MPVLLDTTSPDFAAAFRAFLAMKREVAADVEAASRRIVDDVAGRGDAALIEATQKFDRLDDRCRAPSGQCGRNSGGGEGLRPRDDGRA